jgi:hypothetical protein
MNVTLSCEFARLPAGCDFIQRDHDVRARHAMYLPHLFGHIHTNRCPIAMLNLPPISYDFACSIPEMNEGKPAGAMAHLCDQPKLPSRIFPEDDA